MSRSLLTNETSELDLLDPVSYTHLDVYKRQALQLPNVTVHDLYAHYPDFFIDIAYEQDPVSYTHLCQTGGIYLSGYPY